MRTTKELRKLDVGALIQKINDLKKDLFKARFEVKTGQSKNLHHITINKKQIARINTKKKKKRETPETKIKEETQVEKENE